MLPNKVRRALDVLRRGPRAQAKEIDDEIAFHIQERIDALTDRGWTPEDAKAEAVRRFGDLETERPALFAAAQQRDRPWRLGATMFGAFGVVAALGLYSVIAYSVAQRTGETGIRIALGARGRDIVALVGSQGARLAGIGIVIAVACTAAVAPLVQPLLFQVSARSTGTYVTAGIVMIVVGFVASLVPAARAARVSPMSVIRSE